MWYFRDQPVPLALAVSALIGSSVMGYARAKGEAVGIDPNVGWMARHERGVVLGCATVLAPIVSPYLVWVGLGSIGLFTNITAIWRAVYVMNRMKPAVPVVDAVDETQPDPRGNV